MKDYKPINVYKFNTINKINYRRREIIVRSRYKLIKIFKLFEE